MNADTGGSIDGWQIAMAEHKIKRRGGGGEDESRKDHRPSCSVAYGPGMDQSRGNKALF